VTVSKQKRESKRTGVTLTPWYQSRVKNFIVSRATTEIRVPAVLVLLRLVSLAVPGLGCCADRRGYGHSFNSY